MWNRLKRVFGSSPKESLFLTVHKSDEEMLRAYKAAEATIEHLISFINSDDDAIRCVKLRFKDPALSEKLGEDRFVFLWLANVQVELDGMFVATFFETPAELRSWYRPGEDVRFRREDIFDWFVNKHGQMYGGFTMLVQRARLPEAERGSFDEYTGVRQWMDLKAH